MIDLFNWDQVSINGPIFDLQKLKSFNSDDINHSDCDILKDIKSKLDKIAKLAFPRITLIDDLITEFSYCFGETVSYDNTQITLDKNLLQEYITLIESSDFDKIDILSKNFLLLKD